MGGEVDPKMKFHLTIPSSLPLQLTRHRIVVFLENSLLLILGEKGSKNRFPRFSEKFFFLECFRTNLEQNIL